MRLLVLNDKFGIVIRPKQLCVPLFKLPVPVYVLFNVVVLLQIQIVGRCIKTTQQIINKCFLALFNATKLRFFFSFPQNHTNPLLFQSSLRSVVRIQILISNSLAQFLNHVYYFIAFFLRWYKVL